MNKSSLVIILLLLTLSSVYALTASMGNIRMVLYPAVYPNETTVINKTIKVNNINQEPIFIELSTEGNFSDIITIIDKNFTLAINESKEARFQILLNESGRYDRKIFVTFSSIEDNSSRVGFASNIIIFAKNSTRPVEIETDNESNSSLYVLLALVIIIAVGVGVYVMRGRK